VLVAAISWRDGVTPASVVDSGSGVTNLPQPVRVTAITIHKTILFTPVLLPK
jgi:hypothetical protein